LLTLARYTVLSEEWGINPKSEEQGFPRRKPLLTLARYMVLSEEHVLNPS
jgi:hypothetical protein